MVIHVRSSEPLLRQPLASDHALGSLHGSDKLLDHTSANTLCQQKSARDRLITPMLDIHCFNA